MINLNTEFFDNDKRPRWNFKKANWEDFKTQCKNEINDELLNDQDDEIKAFTENY